MQWTDDAILLSVRKFGESKALVRVFACNHGVNAGIVRGGTSKTVRGILQAGNAVNVTWQARLSEQMGTFKVEPVQSFTAFAMQDKLKLAALTSACALMETSLPERHPYPRLYERFWEFLEMLSGDVEMGGCGDVEKKMAAGIPTSPHPHISTSPSWQEAYVKLELEILAESGFGLDLSQCAATGSAENLIYVSPKSGRAVSEAAGEPYKKKLLALPAFLTSPVRGKVGSQREPGGGKFQPQVNRYNSHSLIPNARELRGTMTAAETRIWYYLRANRLNGYNFRRQHPFSAHYIADFVCLDKKLIIEIDGERHNDQQEYDAQRTKFLETEGYRVLRFWNNDVFENMNGILETILITLEGITPSRGRITPSRPSATLPPNGGGITDGLALTGYFLDTWLAAPHGKKLPAARARLFDLLREKEPA
jgi:DNA repair protein RecO (recombination protein O)